MSLFLDQASFLILVGGLLWLIFVEIHPVLGGLAMAAGFALGAVRQPLWSAPILAAGVTTVHLGLSFHMGMPFRQTGVVSMAGLSLAMLGIVCGAGWVLGRLACRLVRADMPTQPQ